MCIRVTERYAVCQCIYYVHGIDQCGAAGRAGHVIQERTVLVGYACQAHTNMAMASNDGGHYGNGRSHPPQYTGGRIGVLPDYPSSRSTQGSEQYRY